MSFDAFGARRDAINWQDISDSIVTAGFGVFSNSGVGPVTTRGFTGHEMADEVGIIHMNGRIYDPKLARFLQADPFVQSPTDTQMLNRYSYTRNNPLNATDPSGYLSFKSIVKIAITVAIAVFAPELLAGYGGAFATAAGAPSLLAYATTGAFAGAITGGAKGAAIGAFSGFAFGAIGASELGNFARIGAHGVVGGITSVLQGGKFGHGFISAGVTKGVGIRIGDIGNVLAKGMIMAVVGGTISEMSGGEFANGAITAAFAYAFNELQQYRQAAIKAKEVNDLMTHKSDQELLKMSKNEFYNRHQKQASLPGKHGEIAAGVRNSEIAKWHKLHVNKLNVHGIKFGIETLATGMAVIAGCASSACGLSVPIASYSTANNYEGTFGSTTLNRQFFGDDIGKAADVLLDVGTGPKGLIKAPLKVLDNGPGVAADVIGTKNFIEKITNDGYEP